MPQNTHQQLVQVARSLRIPAAEAVRRAVVQFVDTHRPKTTHQLPVPAKSFTELAAQLKKIPQKSGKFASKYDEVIYTP